MSRKSPALVNTPAKEWPSPFGDADGDGFLDAFVTNDAVPNFLFHNRGDGTFEESASAPESPSTTTVRALSSMGAEFRDLDNDGREDLFFTALTNETYPLYRNLGKLLFRDVTYQTKLGKATLTYSGWSCGAFDFDNDGRKDLFTANGDVQTNTERYRGRNASKQRNLLLLNKSDGFTSQTIGEPGLHRGAAFADFDRDGGLDVVVTQLNGPPVFYKPAVTNHWIAFDVKPGTLVRIGSQVNRSTTAVGYASSSPATVHFGLGKQEMVPEAIVIFLGGKVKRLENLKAGQTIAVAAP